MVVLGQPPGHGAVHDLDPALPQPALQLGGAGPGPVQGQQLPSVAIQAGGGLATFADSGSLLAQGGQLGEGIETHVLSVHVRTSSIDQIVLRQLPTDSPLFFHQSGLARTVLAIEII